MYVPLSLSVSVCLYVCFKPEDFLMASAGLCLVCLYVPSVYLSVCLSLEVPLSLCLSLFLCVSQTRRLLHGVGRTLSGMFICSVCLSVSLSLEVPLSLSVLVCFYVCLKPEDFFMASAGIFLVSKCVCLFICPSVHPSVCRLCLSLSLHSMYLSFMVSLFLCLSFSLFHWFTASLSLFLSISLFLCLSVSH
jgi:hypothetical protein